MANLNRNCRVTLAYKRCIASLGLIVWTLRLPTGQKNTLRPSANYWLNHGKTSEEFGPQLPPTPQIPQATLVARGLSKSLNSSPSNAAPPSTLVRSCVSKGSFGLKRSEGRLDRDGVVTTPMTCPENGDTNGKKSQQNQLNTGTLGPISSQSTSGFSGGAKWSGMETHFAYRIHRKNIYNFLSCNFRSVIGGW